MRKGFSLIEMVIVILILGIIAAVAAPRMFDTATTAEQNTTRQQLAVLRNAIEMYRARSGIYPHDRQSAARHGRTCSTDRFPPRRSDRLAVMPRSITTRDTDTRRRWFPIQIRRWLGLQACQRLLEAQR